MRGSWATACMVAAALGAAGSARAQGQPGTFVLEQAISDEAQRWTIAFDGLAFVTGSLESDSFFPPGKVADFWGFQYLRDNDPTGMGHNTDFLTRASLDTLAVLTPAQRAELIALATRQVAAIEQYGYDRFLLMKAFRRLLEGDLPAGTGGLDLDAVRAVSARLYRLDGLISYERAQVMGALVRGLDAQQRTALDRMVGRGMLEWPVEPEPAELRGLPHAAKVAVMTYAGDLFSWYAGSVEADVYFCPERHGAYFGSFYMKDAPAVGNPGYSISTSLTADYGRAFVAALTPAQAEQVNGLVAGQKPALLGLVDARREISIQLRRFLAGEAPPSSTVLALAGSYGELDGEISARYATAFAAVGRSLSAAQQAKLQGLRREVLGSFTPSSPYLYADPVAMPAIPSTDFMFGPAR